MLCVVLLMAVWSVSCSGSSDMAEDSAMAGDSGGEESSAAEAAPSSPDERSDDSSTEAGATDGGAATAGLASVDVGASGRKQTFTATMHVEVDELDKTVREAGTAVEALGGFASNEDVDLGGDATATITYRVPAAGFRSALDAIAEVGDLKNQGVRGEDVTATYADIEGRVATLRTSIARLQGFLAEATDINQIAHLEGELTRREGEFESVEAQRRALADQVELSTITATFDASTTEAPVADDQSLPSFLGALETGWDAMVTGGAVVLAVLGFLLPFLPVVVAAALLTRWVGRRRHTDAVT